MPMIERFQKLTVVAFIEERKRDLDVDDREISKASGT